MIVWLSGFKTMIGNLFAKMLGESKPEHRLRYQNRHVCLGVRP